MRKQITLPPHIMLAPGVRELAEQRVGPQALEQVIERHVSGTLRVEEDEAPIVVDGVALLTPYFLSLRNEHYAWVALWRERHPEVALVFQIGPRDRNGREEAVGALRRLMQAEGGQPYLLFVPSGSELESLMPYSYLDPRGRPCPKDVRDDLLQVGIVVIGDARVTARGVRITGVYWGELGPNSPKAAFVLLELGPWYWKVWVDIDQAEALTIELADEIWAVGAEAFNGDPVLWIDSIVDRHGAIRSTVDDDLLPRRPRRM